MSRSVPRISWRTRAVASFPQIWFSNHQTVGHTSGSMWKRLASADPPNQRVLHHPPHTAYRGREPRPRGQRSHKRAEHQEGGPGLQATNSSSHRRRTCPHEQLGCQKSATDWVCLRLFCVLFVAVLCPMVNVLSLSVSKA